MLCAPLDDNMNPKRLCWVLHRLWYFQVNTCSGDVLEFARARNANVHTAFGVAAQ